MYIDNTYSSLLKVENIRTVLHKGTKLSIKNGYIYCLCQYPFILQPYTDSDTMLSRMDLQDSRVVIEDNILDSTMNNSDFERFAVDVDVVFNGFVVYNEIDKIIEINNITFVDIVRI